MIPWDELDERERAVWSATVGAKYAGCSVIYSDYLPAFGEAADLADKVVKRMREYQER